MKGLLAIASACLLFAACSGGPSFRNTDITGANFGGELALADASGNPRTISEFRGKAVVLFFGYTYCPDVCPTTMLEIKQALEQLGPDSGRVQVLFVTLDPERDTRELLSRYVQGFDPRFIGLSGDAASTAKVAKEFRVFYQKVPGRSPESYSIDHTSGIYVFDARGRLRLYAKPGNPGDLSADLHTLLNAG